MPISLDYSDDADDRGDESGGVAVGQAGSCALQQERVDEAAAKWPAESMKEMRLARLACFS